MENKKFCYIVEEAGRERHEGEFNTKFCVCDTVELAKQRFEEQKAKLLKEEDFFLKEELDNGDFTEHNTISSNGVEMPCLSIETDWEYYELYVCECETG